MKKQQSNRERGMITVEAVLTLVPFILVILGIISFINIFMVHNRVQYAMFQAGSQISAYTYLYQALGIRDADLALQKDINEQTKEIDGLIDQTQKFFEEVDGAKEDINNISNAVDAGSGLISQATDFLSDPKDMLRNLVYLAIEGGEGMLKDFLIQIMENGLMTVYLDQSYDPANPKDTDAYLKGYGITEGLRGFDYRNSNFLSTGDYKMIDVVVEYDIEIFFFKMFMKDPTIHVVQRCAIPAWLDGDSTKYILGE